MYVIQKIEQSVLQAIRAASGKQYTPSADDLAKPPDPKWGEIAFPCFELARGMKKPPAEIAAELAPKIEPKGLISKVEARGPYINFFIDAKALTSETLREIEVAGARYGSWTVGGGKRVLMEYAQPNTHKEVHVGHLRNLLLGQAICNLLQAAGYKVIAVSYHGDVGTHVATVLWGILKFHKDAPPPERDRSGWLGKVYAEATAYLADHPEAKEEIAELNRKLAADDKELVKLWKKTRSWSIKEFGELWRELGLKFARSFYESEMDEPGRKIVAEFLQKGIARESEGAIVVPLEEYGLGAFLILKSDGSTLYSTRDLALAREKSKRWKVERSIVLADVRQDLHFKQLFKTLELTGFKKPMTYVPYEFVTLKEGAISSRRGAVVTYEQFRDEVVRVAEEETKKRHEDWPEHQIQKTARQIAQSAIRIGLLAPDVSRIITFDISAATSFDGFTGPYLQYTGARIAGILRKVAASPPSVRDATSLRPLKVRGGKGGLSRDRGLYPREITAIEKQLLLSLAEYPAVVRRTAGDLRPAPLVNHLFGLAKLFSEFYETIPVIKADPAERAFRLRLIRAIRTVLENGSTLLGIEIPKEM